MCADLFSFVFTFKTMYIGQKTSINTYKQLLTVGGPKRVGITIQNIGTPPRLRAFQSETILFLPAFFSCCFFKVLCKNFEISRHFLLQFAGGKERWNLNLRLRLSSAHFLPRRYHIVGQNKDDIGDEKAVRHSFLHYRNKFVNI